MKSDRQKCLEEMVNSDVVSKALGLYLWRDKYYEVLPYGLTLQRHNWSGFVRRHHKGKTWMVREASEKIIKQYYPKVWNELTFKEALELNPNLVTKK